MKVTRLGPPIPILNSGLGGNAGSRIPAGGNDLQVLTSNGSNGRYWGENVRRITSNGSNTLVSPDVNFASGDNIFFAVASNTLTIHGEAGGAAAAALVFINEVVLGSSAANMTITGIPGTYRDLVIKVLARDDVAIEVDQLYLQVGSGSIDTGSNYAHGRFFDGTGTGTANSGSNVVINAGMCAGANSTAAAFDATSIEIFAYAVTSIRRMVETFSQHYAGEFYTNRGGGVWKNTAAAIDQVRVSPSGGNFVSGSRMTIYGRG